ncbi:MAG: hypothetical protein E7253_08170 [Lachnospiraceae bacterium]|nr:hypothetical protein [Lachnospiraceae bacterium]
MKERIKTFAKKYPLSSMCIFSVISGGLLVFLLCLSFEFTKDITIASFLAFMAESLIFCVVGGVAIGMCVVLPIILTLTQMMSLWREIKGKEHRMEMRHIDLVTIVLGILYNILVLSVLDAVMFDVNWNEVLYNAQKHTPIFTDSYPTIWTIILVSIAGYCIVNFTSIRKIPPLWIVLGLAAMYLGTGLSIVWCIQVMKGRALVEVCLLLLPICCICITARTVMRKMREWKERYIADENDAGIKRKVQEDISCPNSKSMKQGILFRCNSLLDNSDHWPVAAFLLMWPLLGMAIGILALFGQEPDAIIKAFTETSDWNLSKRVAPQNLYMDEHYLCTVAAGGHEKIVKPIRLGVRHGHEVIVNRQLCIANAFEQILEEKTPKFHRMVRNFYDTYGFPIGRWIMKSKAAADVTYFVMKPLEWMFLIVLYLIDVNPENRIVIQYTGKRLDDFLIR